MRTGLKGPQSHWNKEQPNVSENVHNRRLHRDTLSTNYRNLCVCDHKNSRLQARKTLRWQSRTHKKTPIERFDTSQRDSLRDLCDDAELAHYPSSHKTLVRQRLKTSTDSSMDSYVNVAVKPKRQYSIRALLIDVTLYLKTLDESTVRSLTIC